MKRQLRLYILIFLLATRVCYSQITLAGWSAAGQTNFGVSPFTATISDANVSVSGINRGAVISTSGSAIPDAWGGAGWASTSANAISTGAYIYFTISAKLGYTSALKTLNLYYRKASDGPPGCLMQYSVNGSSYITFVTNSNLFNTSASGGSAITAINLSGIIALQNVSVNDVVTIRIIPYGNAGYWCVYKSSGNTDISILGTVNIASLSIPTSLTATEVTETGFRANWTSASGATGYRLDVSRNPSFSTFEAGYYDLNVGLVTSFVVSSLNSGSSYYYRVRSVNAGGNSSNSETQSLTTLASSKGYVRVTFIPEGYYNYELGNLLVSDTFTVTLANVNGPDYADLETASIKIDSSTFSGTAEFSSAQSGNYYIYVKGKSAMSTWSATPIAFTKGGTVNYDFTTTSSKAYSIPGFPYLPMILQGSKWCVYSGDVDQDELIGNVDLTLIDNDAFITKEGRTATDLDGDGLVGNVDLTICDNHAYWVVESQSPRKMSAMANKKIYLPRKSYLK